MRAPFVTLLIACCLAAAAVSCVGPAGPPGAAGRDGVDGADGADGQRGAVGPQGDAARDGAPGATGPVGPPGDAGRDGRDGLDGVAPWNAGPGLALALTGLVVTDAGLEVALAVTDADGGGLDVRGVASEGAVSLSFVLAHAAREGAGLAPHALYRSSADAGGVDFALDGRLAPVDVRAGAYRFVAAAPAGFEPGHVQTLLVSGRRASTAGTTTAHALGSVAPSGPAPQRQHVTQAQCVACHGALRQHAAGYDDVAHCPLCHQPQLAALTGLPLDLPTLLHRVHAGAALPSVLAGTPLVLRPDAGARDYSTVRFPQPLARCEACHGGGQGDAWRVGASLARCTTCHDRTDFGGDAGAGFTPHGGGEARDGTCGTCHLPGGDAGTCAGAGCSIAGSHARSPYDPALPRLELELGAVTNAAPGQAPSFGFVARLDGAPRQLTTSPLTLLRVTLASPVDVAPQFPDAGFSRVVIQGAGARGSLVALDGGAHRYDFPALAPLPFTATGTYALALEGALTLPSGQLVVARSAVTFFAVTGAAPRPPRRVVDGAKCEACHGAVEHHTFSRGVDVCLACHGPSLAAIATVPRVEGTSVAGPSLDFKVLVHALHMGARRSAPYRLSTTPLPTAANPQGTVLDFGALRFPRSPGACEACHAAAPSGAAPTWALPARPLPPSAAWSFSCSEDPSADSNQYCEGPFWNATAQRALPPETAACGACHDAPAAEVHAQLNADAAGREACATCHAPGRLADVAAVHAVR